MFVKWTSTVRRTAHEEPRRTMRPSLTQTISPDKLSLREGVNSYAKVFTEMLCRLSRVS